MCLARMYLNRVHNECIQKNASIFMHQQSDDVIVVVRQIELDMDSSFDCYVSITRQCYYEHDGDHHYKTNVELPGFVSEVLFAGWLEI
mmetsp:Transcript_6363/g.4531  ORF Transcript_6363/g.4531 Transcript_6363/m.4531 type:complete len:88 (+) Transcript_6363:2485-2748(+)